MSCPAVIGSLFLPIAITCLEMQAQIKAKL